MDREVIEQKLESLRRCLRRVAEKCPPDPPRWVVTPIFRISSPSI
jgi:hypothetical protein